MTRITIPQKVLLNVGSGDSKRSDLHPNFRGPEWKHVTLDIDPSIHPDMVGDIRTLEPVASDSVDCVYSSHNLEHLHHWDVIPALRSFFRVLKPGGHLCAVVPDFREACRLVAEGKGFQTLYDSPAGPIAPVDIIFGYRAFTYEKPFYRHLFGFTRELLTEMVMAAGFVVLDVTEQSFSWDIWLLATKKV